MECESLNVELGTGEAEEHERGTYLIDAVFCVVVPHGALEDAGGSLAVPPRHPFRVLEDVAQHFAGAGGG